MLFVILFLLELSTAKKIDCGCKSVILVDVKTNQTQLHIFWIGIKYTLVRFLFLTLNRYSKIGQYTRTLAHEHLGLGKSGPDSLVQTPIDRTLGKTSEANLAVGPAVEHQ